MKFYTKKRGGISFEKSYLLTINYDYDAKCNWMWREEKAC